MRKSILLLTAAAMIAMVACKPEEVKPNENPAETTRAYVLNEGAWGGNNASLSLITPEGITNDWFAKSNNRGLGDLAQDMIHYGSKLYVVTNESNTLECIDPATGVSSKQIDMGSRHPRYMVAHKGKIYVSCYDKTVVRIDTASLAIDATCQLSGMQPEQLCVVGENLYVCNSWQNDSNGQVEYDNTLSVVNLGTYEETGKITVASNPTRMKALDDHRLLVACTGNYADDPATTLVIDLNNGSQTPLGVAATNFDICDGYIYLYCTSYDANWNATAAFYKVNATTLEATPILEDYGNDLRNAYGINVDPTTKNLYVCNSTWSVNGDVFIFSPENKLLGKYEAGIYTSKVVF